MGILYDSRKVKAMEYLSSICEYAGKSSDFIDELWLMLLTDSELYDEFIYYVENHTFKDSINVRGYSLSDIYVWQMDKYNLIRELGKNPDSCNKETMVMNAFYEMANMKKNPDEYVKRIESGKGNDKL